MTLDEVLGSLCPDGLAVEARAGIVIGSGRLRGGLRADLIAVADRTPIGVDEAILLARAVLDAMRRGGDGPIVVLVDSDSQRMSRRDELLGLSEYLAHLGKCLIQADRSGRHTVGVLYGHSAAGAFIATALATRTLVALPGAEPEVMDLPSMARVTKLPLDTLRQMARSTPVFAPGLDNLASMGAVSVTWDPARSLSDQLQAILDAAPADGDARDRLGCDRKGRPKAAMIAARVHDLACRSR